MPPRLDHCSLSKSKHKDRLYASWKQSVIARLAAGCFSDLGIKRTVLRKLISGIDVNINKLQYTRSKEHELDLLNGVLRMIDDNAPTMNEFDRFKTDVKECIVSVMEEMK
jgi:hypothetical protein